LPIILYDTAGIRATKNKVEKIGINLALKKAKESNLNILIIDGTQKKIPNEINKLINEKSLLIINKQDKKTFVKNFYLKELKNKKFIGHYDFSTITKYGYNHFIKALEDLVGELYSNHTNTLISRSRHRNLLIKTSKHLKNYLRISKSKDIEKVAEELRISSNFLGEIVGFIGVEEVLGKIFKDFCIGK